MYKMIALSSMVLSLLVSAPYGFADEGGKQGRQSTHMKVSGVVSKVQSGLATVKTPWGSMTIASDTERQKLEVGEEVEMTVEEGNMVIDVHRKGEPAHAHRYITGNLVYVGRTKKEIKLWTPEGEKVFPLDRLELKTGGIEEGALVTVELNEAGTVIDLHRFTVEMSFDEHPHTKKPGHRITAHGVVEKIQSGVIFAKTPFATYRLSVKTAPSGIQVGDEITLWVNKDNMVIDHHMKGHQHAHRLVSGKLIYVGRNKKQIKLWTPEGEKVFPLERLEVKANSIKEGSTITIELNENGTVIDLWKAS